MNLFGLLCLLVSTVLVSGSNNQPNDNQKVQTEQYLLTFPQILSSTGNKICLTLLNGYVPKEKDLHVTISGDKNRETLTETFRIEKDTQCFDLETRNIKSSYVTLKVKVESVIDVSQVIPFAPSYGMTMIETSKPVYQPGEELRFRVIGFDGSMKALNNDFVSIALHNPENVKVMEWKGKSLDQGMKHYEAELASNNKQGIWRIVGVTKSGETVDKLFQVAKKIQPEVNIKITRGDKFILQNEGDHRMVVCAEDKKGFRLNEGVINVKVGNHLVIHETPLEEDGCVHLNLKNETFRWASLVGKAIDGTIEYINRATGVYEYKPFYLPVVRAQVHLRVPSIALVKSYFKPGLPYFGYLIVETPNYTPLPNAEVEVCYRTTNKPWQFEDSQEKTCKKFTSSGDGLIKFIIPPVTQDIKQILIDATIPGVTDHQQTFALSSWAGETSTQFLIKPIVRVESCKRRMPEAAQFTVLMTRNGTALFDKLYLQSAGRVSSAQPKLVNVKPTPYQPDLTITIGKWPESLEIYSANIYQEADPESDKHSVMNRIVMYGLDHKGNLISDSIAYLKDCLRDESLMSVKVDKSNRIAVELKVPQETPCSVAIGTSAERGRLTEQKINKLAEKYDDIYAKGFEWDRCNLAQLERSRDKPLIIDFKNNWDTFKEMGLRAVYSKSDIFKKPCQWEVFDTETVNKSLEGLFAVRHNLPYPEHIMTSLADSANMAQLNRLENKLIGDLLFWGSKEDLRKFLNSLKPSDLASISEIAVHAICMDRIHGVRSYSVVKSLNVAPLYIESDLPRTVYQETVQNVTLYIKRHESSFKQSECVPVEFDFEKSDSYEIVSEVLPVCSCSMVTRVPLMIRPLKTGPLNLKFIARLSSSLSNECSSQIEGFEPQQTVIKTDVKVYEPKVTLRNYALACKNLPKTLQASEHDEKIHVAQDFFNILLKQIRDDKAIQANILELLAKFNGLATMYAQNEKNLPTALSRRIQKDILELFQELALYKLPRGPFTFNSGNQRVPSLVATSLAYKAIAQIQDRLPQFNGADVLTEVFEFITGRMMKDGCFRPKTYSNIPRNSWPFDHQVASKELTVFVASTLAEVKQTPKIVLKRALKCIDQRQSEESDYLTRAMTALLYAKMNKTDLAKELTRDLEGELINLQSLGERRISSRFMSQETENLKSNDENLRALAYLVKAKLALNQTDSIQQHIQKLVDSNLSLEDPLVVDAIATAWRIISSDKPVIAEIAAKKISLEKFEMKKIELSEKKNWHFGSSNEGCVILERVQEIPINKYERAFPIKDEEKMEDSWATKKGETPAQYVRRGFKILKIQRKSDEPCKTRKLNICVDENSKDFESEQRFTILAPRNYWLDESLLERMIASHQTPIERYISSQRNEFEIYVKSMKGGCFMIPLINGGELLENEPNVTITKHNMFDAPTSGAIEIPIQKDCSVRARRNVADQSNSSASSAKPNRSTNSQQPNNNQGRGYDTQVEAVEQQQTYDAPAYPAPAYEAPIKGYPAPAYAPPAYEPPAYQAPAYEPPVKGYAPPPPPPPPPAYEPPAYQAPAYEPPVKGYAPPPPPPPAYEPPAYQAPAYEPPAYQAPAYEPPVKGYAPPPPPAYEPPAYQAPAYEPPVKGYAPPPPPPPAYEPPAYQAPAYEPPAYQAPAYEPPVKGYAPPPPPAYEPPAYQAPAYEPPVKGYAPPPLPAYEPPAYQAPAYEPPVKGYAPPPPPAYEPPAYQAPAYEPPVKGYAPPPPPAYEPPAYQAPAYEPPAYAPPAYAPPAYAPPAYAPPAYAPPAYEPPAYQAPAYEPPVKGYAPPPPPAYEPPAYPAPAYAPPAYAPPAYAPPPPAYAPPAYEAPAYQAPAYEPPAKGYLPPPPPPPPAYPAPAPAYQAPAYEPPAKGYPALPLPAYAPPAYDAPAYRETQGRSTQLRYGNSFASNNGQQARNSVNAQRSNSQNQQRGNNLNKSAQQYRAAFNPFLQSNTKLARELMQRQTFSGSRFVRHHAAASEVKPVSTRLPCLHPQVSTSCPVCSSRIEVSMIDNICRNASVLATLKSSHSVDESVTCGAFDVNHSFGANLTHIRDEQFTINPKCDCNSMTNRNNVIIISDLLKSDAAKTTHKEFGAETFIIPATALNVQDMTTFYNTICGI